ncbi:MAG: HAMP domain-containing histidine kinase [Clostridiales Family XIII bacterium]|nr:HAMP domain-containing histidine kinase [Clostridiales Family XIII bacterium]
MDTKSRSFNDRFAVRAIAFVLCLACIGLAGAGFMRLCDEYRRVAPYGPRDGYSDGRVVLLDLAGSGDYERSLGFMLLSESYVWTLRDLLSTKESVEAFAGDLAAAGEDIEIPGLLRDANDDGLIEEWEEDGYRNEARSAVMRHEYDMRHLEQGIKELERTEGLGFYISDGENALGSADTAGGAATVAAGFKKRAAWLAYEDGRLLRSPESPERYADIDRQIEQGLYYYNSGELMMYISFDGKFLAERGAALSEARERAKPWIAAMLAGLAAALALLIYLVAATGRRDENGKVRLYAADRIFTEVQLAVCVAAAIICGIGAALWADSDPSRLVISGDSVTDTALLLGLGLLVLAVALWFLLALVRCIKARRFFKNTLVWLLCRLVYRILMAIKAVFDRRNPMSKTLILIIALCALSATRYLIPVAIALIIAFGPRWVRKYSDIRKGVEEARSGNLSWRIPVAEGAKGEFDELARGINEMSEASGAAVQNELKNQRLKTDLISNVSHDLKTPLTSIMTYVDLLKMEGLDSPSAPEYLSVLDQKSQRLKKLTEDLFEAAKASSGAIPVHMEKVDLLSLVRQGLGEMSEGVLRQGLDIKLKFESERHYVRADGQLLWRIVENLLGNVQKYALEGSRVYIDLTERASNGGEMTILEMKNISKAPLNISADELMERFIRGDESRATEGSGLGLAIAKDLARLQNGWFELKIDGDLFKAVLMLEKWPEAA